MERGGPKNNNTCRQRNRVCWNSSFVHFHIPWGTMNIFILSLDLNPFVFPHITCHMFVLGLVLLLSSLGDDHFSSCPDENTSSHQTQWNKHRSVLLKRLPDVHFILCKNPNWAHLYGLTCPSALAPPLGLEDETFFLKGIPTFHPFVFDWREKSRKSARKSVDDGAERGGGNAIKQTGWEVDNVEGTTNAYLAFGCHLFSQSLQAIPHLYKTQICSQVSDIDGRSTYIFNIYISKLIFSEWKHFRIASSVTPKNYFKSIIDTKMDSVFVCMCGIWV